MFGQAAGRARLGIRVLCGGGVVLAAVAAASPAVAQDQAALQELREALARQQRQIEAQQRLLSEQGATLERQRRLLETQGREIQALRGPAPPRSATPAPVPAAPPAAAVAAAPQPAPARPATPPPQVATEAAAAAQARREERRVAETDPSLARTGGVLTARGALVVEPALDYAYSSQNRSVVNGFTVIPGITFGTLDIREVQRRTVTGALTARLGVTDWLELNTRIPVVWRSDTTTTTPADVDARPITIGPTGFGLGDIEFAASYQINDFREGAPVFVGNLRVKTATGRSPFEVPVYTPRDPRGDFLRGLERELPTGSGFWAVEPGLTMIFPTDPAVLFASARYIWNVADTVTLPSLNDGPGARVRLDPGDGLGLNFGIGFALNDATSFTLGYEHVHVLPARQSGQVIRGSAYDIGTFNFGVSYRLTDATSINLGVGVGVTEAAPDLRIGFRLPIRMNLF
jgi:hypothetical protein